MNFILAHWWNLLLLIPLTAIAGWSYREGGSKNDFIGRWIREIGVGVSILVWLSICLGWSIWGLFVLGAVFIETTYFKAKGSSATPLNWFIVGLSYAVVPLPYVLGALLSHQGNYCKGFLIRAVVVTLFTTLWRTFQGDANKQEIGCGCIQVITLPLLWL